MAYTLGIDFGTSTTRVALCPEGAIPQPIPIGHGAELFMPSVVAYRNGAHGYATDLTFDGASVSEKLVARERIRERSTAKK